MVTSHLTSYARAGCHGSAGFNPGTNWSVGASWSGAVTRCHPPTRCTHSMKSRFEGAIWSPLRPAVDSGQPRSVTHDGSPGQILGLPPDLDALGSEHQVDVVAAVGLGVPARLGGIPFGQRRRRLGL